MVNLKEFRKANGLTQEDLAYFWDVAKSFISQVENGKSKLPDDKLTELLNNDKGWDVCMLVSDDEPKVEISHFSHSNVATGRSQININGSMQPEEQLQEEDMVPVIPTKLYKESDVNILEYVNDEDNNVHMTPAIQQFPKTDMFYTVQTMAMYPHLHQGDILALKALKKSTPIVNGELYAIDTVDLGILVRFIYDRGDKIELKGSEKDDRFESFFLDKEDIYNYFRVVGLVRTNI